MRRAALKRRQGTISCHRHLQNPFCIFRALTKPTSTSMAIAAAHTRRRHRVAAGQSTACTHRLSNTLCASAGYLCCRAQASTKVRRNFNNTLNDFPPQRGRWPFQLYEPRQQRNLGYRLLKTESRSRLTMSTHTCAHTIDLTPTLAKPICYVLCFHQKKKIRQSFAGR